LCLGKTRGKKISPNGSLLLKLQVRLIAVFILFLQHIAAGRMHLSTQLNSTQHIFITQTGINFLLVTYTLLY
jgi:hypothetical protein